MMSNNLLRRMSHNVKEVHDVYIKIRVQEYRARDSQLLYYQD